jgi:hypothetical protein
LSIAVYLTAAAAVAFLAGRLTSSDEQSRSAASGSASVSATQTSPSAARPAEKQAAGKLEHWIERQLRPIEGAIAGGRFLEARARLRALVERAPRPIARVRDLAFLARPIGLQRALGLASDSRPTSQPMNAGRSREGWTYVIAGDLLTLRGPGDSVLLLHNGAGTISRAALATDATKLATRNHERLDHDIRCAERRASSCVQGRFEHLGHTLAVARPTLDRHQGDTMAVSAMAATDRPRTRRDDYRAR